LFATVIEVDVGVLMLGPVGLLLLVFVKEERDSAHSALTIGESNTPESLFENSFSLLLSEV